VPWKTKGHFFAIFGMEKLQQAVTYLVFSLPSMASIQAQHISLKAKIVKLQCVLIGHSSLMHINKWLQNLYGDSLQQEHIKACTL